MADETSLAEFWKLDEVMRRTALSRSVIYRYMASGAFPQARALGPRATAWWAADVIAWMESRPQTTIRREIALGGTAASR
jgi:predicted DNA-binding transcriptional regulator AlpA